MERFLHFSASSSVKNLFGRGLVTDQIAAVFELVKNSYDADAEKVELIFEGLSTDTPSLTVNDDGTGMSLDDIKSKWMIIGTNSKKKDTHSPIFKRPFNGDKGIGRFSVDRLGGLLYMEAIKRGEPMVTSAFFDWSKFEVGEENIESILIPYEQTPIKSEKSGLSLRMTGLRDEWDEQKVKVLFRNLRQFKSPLSIDDNFRIFLTAKELGYELREVTVERLEGVSSLWIEAEIKKETPNVIFTTINKDGIDYEATIANTYKFGTVKAQVFTFTQGDKIRFRNRYGIRVREYGNIRLFRDGFRVYPYGEGNNDWLDIDRRMAQGFSRYLGSRDLIGYIQITKAENQSLIPLTSRQGLEENDAFNELRRFIVDVCIKTLERYFFEVFKKNTNETLTNSRREINYAINGIRDIIGEIRKELPDTAETIQQYVHSIENEQKKQVEYVKGQQELVKVYSRIAQKETFLHKIIHQSMIDVKAAGTAIENIRLSKADLSDEDLSGFSIAEKYIQSAVELLSRVRDDVVRKREKKNIDISEAIKVYYREMEDTFRNNQIEAKLNVDEQITYTIDEGDLKAILNNLTTNAVKSLIKINNRQREILIELRKTDKFIIFKITDTGVGIEETERERIFDPFHSTTEGFGLGLTIVDETLKEYGGQLELMIMEKPGACFTFKLR